VSDAGSRRPGVGHARATDPAAEILEQLRGLADPERARSEQAYLKSGRDFLGVSVPAGRRVVRAVLADRSIVDHDEVVALALALWSGAYFELRRAAVEVLAARVEALGEADLPLIESLVRDAETWALVDGLAGEVAASIVARGVTPGIGAWLDRCAVDPESFWVRRLALLALLRSLKSGSTEWSRFSRYADGMVAEREFFIRKAIGWVLREVSKRDPELVREWVDAREGRLSGVTRREAVKFL